MTGNRRLRRLLLAGVAGVAGMAGTVSAVVAPAPATAATPLCVTYAQVTAYTTNPGYQKPSYFYFGSEVAVTSGVYNQQTIGMYRMPTLVNQSGTTVIVAHYNAESYSFTSSGWHALTYAC